MLFRSYGLHFDPFDFSLYSVIYLSGGFACVICAIIISVRHLVVDPVRNAVSRKRKKRDNQLADDEFESERQSRERQERDKEESLYPPMREEEKRPVPPYLLDVEEGKDEKGEEKEDDLAASLLFDWLPKKTEEKEKEPEVRSVPKKEIPQIYFSTLDPDVLVYEYSDRFELYRAKDDEPSEFIGVEYK